MYKNDYKQIAQAGQQQTVVDEGNARLKYINGLEELDQYTLASEVDDIKTAIESNIENLEEQVEEVVQYTIPVSGSVVELECENNNFYKCTDTLTSLDLTIADGQTNVYVQFNTGSDFTYDLDVPDGTLISKEIAFEDNTKYILAFDHNILIFSELTANE